MKDYIEERAMNIANYMIERNVTVRQTVKELGIGKDSNNIEWFEKRKGKTFKDVG